METFFVTQVSNMFFDHSCKLPGLPIDPAGRQPPADQRHSSYKMDPDKSLVLKAFRFILPRLEAIGYFYSKPSINEASQNTQKIISVLLTGTDHTSSYFDHDLDGGFSF
jgi:hypothetical protein